MARILVVDDDPNVCEFVKDALIMAGHSVETAFGGAAALESVKRRRCDIMILDRSMPGMSGLEVLSTLRRLPEGKGMKVLMCTGSGMMSDVNEALSVGADDYIIKPIDLARLQEKVARHAPAPGAAPEQEPAGLKGLLRRLLPF